MTAMLAFAGRNAREILRDKLTLFFGLIFPVLILALMSLIGRGMPVNVFPIEKLAPGLTVFGLSFMSLFAGSLTAKDRSGAFMMRLLSSPMTGGDFIAGYILPLLPIAMGQSLICLLSGTLFGLPMTWSILLVPVALLPAALLFISLGLALGSVLSEKQIGGVCGALLTNLTAWLSGVWFDPELIGGAFAKVCRFLPFFPAVRAAEGALVGNSPIWPHIMSTSLWAAGAFVISVPIFNHFSRRG